MLDAPMRRRLARPLDRVAAALDRPHITPDRLTMLGLLTGLASATTAAGQLWWWALGLWLLSRLLDGLDGPLARRRNAAAAGADDPRGGPSQAGGFLDITADFIVYGATVVGVAVGASRGEGASLLPFVAVLLAYYVNGTAFLAFSSIAERTGHQIDDGRCLNFLGGLAEGTETIVVHALWLLLPALAADIAWVWAAVVAVSAVQRMTTGYLTLRRPVP